MDDSRLNRPADGAQADPYADRLMALVDAAREADAPERQAAVWLEAQRVTAWGMRAAVSRARSSGLSWRDLSGVLCVPAASLHRQYQAGGGLFPGGDSGECPLLSQESSALTVVAAGDRRPDGPPRQLPELPLNLFVGREREVADLSRMVRRRRLVTVTGPVGVGKTRLALEIAHQSDAFRGGVFWAPLAGVPADSDARQIAAAVQPDSLGGPLGNAVARAARLGAVLLVVDNCEHVVTGVGEFVHSLLAGNPAVTVLATSRAVLDVPGEARFRLDPFPVVPTDPGDPWRVGSAATRLFVDRARLASHSVSLAGHEQTIAELCNALDRLPLAIELAAKQCAVMPVAALSGQLGRQLDRAGSRPGVHTGLRAAIAWSYDLLEPVEQALFRRLALLPDGATEASAAALGQDLGLDRASVWGVLSALTGRSMLTAADTQPVRFTMLMSIRAYGREQLDTRHETSEVTELLVAWLTRCADERLASLYIDRWEGPREVAAFQLAADAARRGQDPRYPRLAISLAFTLVDMGDLDGAQRLLASLTRSADLPPALEVRAQIAMAYAMGVSGDTEAALEHAGRARSIALAGCELLVQYQASMSLALGVCNDPARALAHAVEQVAIFRAQGTPGLLSRGLNNLAWCLLINGRVDDAMTAIEEMLERPDAVDPTACHTAGYVALAAGDLQQASTHFTRGLATTTSDLRRIELIEGQGCVAAAQNRPERALRLLAGAAAHRERVGFANYSWCDEQIAAARACAVPQMNSAEAAIADRAGGRLSIDHLVDYAREKADAGVTPDTPLNERETAVAVLVARGYATKQIAGRLKLAPGTVSAYIASSRAKLGLANRAELAAWTMRHHPDLITG